MVSSNSSFCHKATDDVCKTVGSALEVTHSFSYTQITPVHFVRSSSGSSFTRFFRVLYRNSGRNVARMFWTLVCRFAGFMVDLISTPVTSGFTTATSIIIVLSQLKGILGVRFKGDTVVDIVEKLFEHFHERRNGDIYLGLSAIAFILIIRVRARLVLSVSD